MAVCEGSHFYIYEAWEIALEQSAVVPILSSILLGNSNQDSMHHCLYRAGDFCLVGVELEAVAQRVLGRLQAFIYSVLTLC